VSSILILDEPTSSVDTETEVAIMVALERLMQGRTTFMIAHRLSTLATCDARLEIEHGRLISHQGSTGFGDASLSSMAAQPRARRATTQREPVL
jgi:ABC-type multidrug transport system fused ATPase/permease subunit